MAPRSTRAKPAPEPESESSIGNVPALTREQRQHRMFILPRSSCNEARILSLPDPASSNASGEPRLMRYYFCPKNGLFEFKAISSPAVTPRSWLLVREQLKHNTQDTSLRTQTLETSNGISGDASFMGHEGLIQQKPELLVATPYDLLFFIIPLLDVHSKNSGLYRMEDDYMDLLEKYSKRLASLLHHESFRKSFFDRLAAVSDTQDIGDDRAYRMNEEYIVKELMEKAIHITADGTWPSSMESELVQKELEMPLVSTAMVSAPIVPTPNIVVDGPTTSVEPENGSAVASDESQPSTDTENSNKVKLKKLSRLDKALHFMLKSYVHPDRRKTFESVLFAPNSKHTDFAPLEERRVQVEKARDEARALRSLSDNISRKRSAADDDEAAEARAEKKRRKEEEDKKKKNESRGLKNLQKADTSGMKKLSSFFQKAK